MGSAPKPRDSDLDFFGLTDQGRVRQENQDHFLYATLHKLMRVGGTSLPNRELLELPSERLASFALVADGVGGSADGETASRAALETIADYVTNSMRCFYTADTTNQTTFLEALRAGAVRTHEAVSSRAAERGPGHAIATTLTGLLAVWPMLYLLQVGDSRCYRFRNGQLQQLTRDQTMAQDLVDLGILPAERADRTRYAHVLSSSIGGQASQPVVSAHEMLPGDVLMLCTDGLTKHVT
ncbi:MAG: PP2C family serine/threonine-protein phosphatase, partial [Gemmatimonadales bacterium]